MDESELEENGVWRILGESGVKRAPAGFVGDVMRKIRVGREEFDDPGWLAWALPFFSAVAFVVVVLCSGLIDDGVSGGEFYADYGLYEVESVVANASRMVWSLDNQIQQ